MRRIHSTHGGHPTENVIFSIIPEPYHVQALKICLHKTLITITEYFFSSIYDLKVTFEMCITFFLSSFLFIIKKKFHLPKS